MATETPTVFNPYELLSVKNAEIPINLLKWFIKGHKTVAITGDMATGKTTFLQSLIGFVNPSDTIHVKEQVSELDLQRHYPTHNIVTIENDEEEACVIPIHSVTVVGEVVTDKQAEYVMQNTIKSTLFTHNAKSTKELVGKFARYIVDTKRGIRLDNAIEAVSKMGFIDCHMAIKNGKHIIERITEVVPCNSTEHFKIRTLAEWHDDKYYLIAMPTDSTMEYITNSLSKDKKAEYDSDMQTIMKLGKGA